MCSTADTYRLGEAVPAGALSILDSRLLEEFAVFNFRYRSHSECTKDDVLVQY